MKFMLVLCLLLAGCQTAAPVAPLPLPAKSAPEPRFIAATPGPSTPPAVPDTAALEQKIRQQAQLIEALISQNDALTSRLAAVPAAAAAPVAPPTPTASSPEPATAPAIASAPPSAPPTPAIESLLLPNADGVIDLAAVDVAATPGEPANPFAVRTVPPGTGREVSLHVGGIIAGPTPCAVINDRLVQSGETIEAFAVERIDADAVFLRHGDHRLRLPVAEQPARIRLPL